MGGRDNQLLFFHGYTYKYNTAMRHRSISKQKVGGIMNFFDALVDIFKSKKNKNLDKSSIQDWARIEYKNDAAWALDRYSKTGKFPRGDKEQNRETM